MFKIRAIAVGIIVGSIFAWRDAAVEDIHASAGVPAYVYWAIILPVFWAMGLIMVSLIWPTVERLLVFFAVQTFPFLFPDHYVDVVNRDAGKDHPQGPCLTTIAGGKKSAASESVQKTGGADKKEAPKS